MCGIPASELAELDGWNLDRSWIEFGVSGIVSLAWRWAMRSSALMTMR
jgi:hypothetical protein